MPDRLMPGISASAWAAPMPTATGNVTSRDRPRPRAEAVGDEQDHAADDEHQRDEPDLAELVFDEIAEQHADDRGGDRGGDEQPGEPTVRVAPERAIAHRGEPGRDKRAQSARK